MYLTQVICLSNNKYFWKEFMFKVSLSSIKLQKKYVTNLFIMFILNI